MQVQLVIFSAQKDGYAPADWEDGAGGGSFDRGHGGDPACARFAVADGATETYDSGRWADQLIASFISPEQASGAGHPDLERDAMSAWFSGSCHPGRSALARRAGTQGCVGDLGPGYFALRNSGMTA